MINEHPTKQELKEFEKAKEQCPFCKDISAGARHYRSKEKDSIYFSCCDRVLVCNDIGLFEETY